MRRFVLSIIVMLPVVVLLALLLRVTVGAWWALPGWLLVGLPVLLGAFLSELALSVWDAWRARSEG